MEQLDCGFETLLEISDGVFEDGFCTFDENSYNLICQYDSQSLDYLADNVLDYMKTYNYKSIRVFVNGVSFAFNNDSYIKR